MADVEISDAEKVKIASQFLLQSPPGEFNEVFNDIRVLLNNDTLLERGCATAISQYNKDQFVPVKVEGAEAPTLVTEHNELPDGRFVDPKSRKVFRYDHLRKDATEVQQTGPQEVDEKMETWRKALQSEIDEYTQEHFYGTGVATVFTSKGSITLCIESHQFQPKNFWNGRWRSEWRLPIFDGKSGVHACNGKIRLQVHYYEDGNVQLISNKAAKVDVKMTSDINASARELVTKICESESNYQASVQESYAVMSDTTFKALRRQLPITRSKLDWLKLQSYRVAQDMKPQ
ncbi:f-actin capping protein alpha subunit domain-containing protein [Ditylenchus destructor]|uniref:F-actin-capping protein subunit alpha n=1 Tax=Ditylenchus destructor TaxID=166010 RepID=A0AAD4NET5_9BILA|nr:f-actin capping protein alpha subunit domain-containing protein [Ditylenchus destructor]